MLPAHPVADRAADLTELQRPAPPGVLARDLPRVEPEAGQIVGVNCLTVHRAVPVRRELDVPGGGEHALHPRAPVGAPLEVDDVGLQGLGGHAARLRLIRSSCSSAMTASSWLTRKSSSLRVTLSGGAMKKMFPARPRRPCRSISRPDRRAGPASFGKGSLVARLATISIAAMGPRPPRICPTIPWRYSFCRRPNR